MYKSMLLSLIFWDQLAVVWGKIMAENENLGEDNNERPVLSENHRLAYIISIIISPLLAIMTFHETLFAALLENWPNLRFWSPWTVYVLAFVGFTFVVGFITFLIMRLGRFKNENELLEGVSWRFAWSVLLTFVMIVMMSFLWQRNPVLFIYPCSVDEWVESQPTLNRQQKDNIIAPSLGRIQDYGRVLKGDLEIILRDAGLSDTAISKAVKEIENDIMEASQKHACQSLDNVTPTSFITLFPSATYTPSPTDTPQPPIIQTVIETVIQTVVATPTLTPCTVKPNGTSAIFLYYAPISFDFNKVEVKAALVLNTLLPVNGTATVIGRNGDLVIGKEFILINGGENLVGGRDVWLLRREMIATPNGCIEQIPIIPGTLKR